MLIVALRLSLGLAEAMRLPELLRSSIAASRLGPRSATLALSVIGPASVENENASTSVMVSMMPEPLTVLPVRTSDVPLPTASG